MSAIHLHPLESEKWKYDQPSPPVIQTLVGCGGHWGRVWVGDCAGRLSQALALGPCKLNDTEEKL